jgi:hypothetical protein
VERTSLFYVVVSREAVAVKLYFCCLFAASEPCPKAILFTFAIDCSEKRQAAIVTDVYVNVRKYGKNVILATCDCEICGTVLRDGKIVFEVKEDFYKGRKVTVEEAIELCKQSSIVNMVGKCIVHECVKAGLVHPEAVLDINGVPHAQIVKI